MKYYLTFYSNILNRSSYKFLLNIFFLKNNNGLPLSHTLFPHFFINTKNLKIKFLKSNSINFYWSFLTVVSALFLLVSFLFFIAKL